jgi:environmental stress-induced protein Ves
MPLVLLSERAPQPWRNGGGLTRELLAWTPGAGSGTGEALGADPPRGASEDIGGRGGNGASMGPGSDWLLRVSVADITQDGPFSPYPGVHRAFAVLEGAGVVLQWPQGERVLGPGDEALAFDGEAAPGCRLVGGPTRDLNLMVRSSAGQASMRQAESGQPGPPPTRPWRALYTHGGAVLQADGQALALPPGSLWWDDTGPAGAHWLLQAGVGAWWLEMGGPEEVQPPLHGKLRAAAGQGGTRSVRAEPVEALQERPGSRALRQAQGERWLADRPSTGSGGTGSGRFPSTGSGRTASGRCPSTGSGRTVGDAPQEPPRDPGPPIGSAARCTSLSPSPLLTCQAKGNKTGLGASPAEGEEGPQQPTSSDR